MCPAGLLSADSPQKSGVSPAGTTSVRHVVALHRRPRSRSRRRRGAGLPGGRMPRRTVTVTRLWATTRRRMDETQDLSRLGGAHDVLHLARAFFAGIPPQDLIDHKKERYVAI